MGAKDSSIYGRLGSVGLNDILQLLGMTSRTATVSIDYRGREGKIFVQDGVVLHASAGQVSGEDALLRLVHWSDGDFAIEDGIHEPVTPTISKSVDAVMLDVLTQLDESKRDGAPVFTPFPPLDKLDERELSALEAKVKRSARIKPPVPRRRSRNELAGAIVVAVVALGLGVAFMMMQTLAVDADGLPSVDADPASPSEAEVSNAGIAEEVLQAASSETSVDTLELLAAHGVSLQAASPEPVAPAPTPAPTPVPTTGELLVIASPWARVTVDGRDVGETPLPAFEFSSGEHEIVLSNPGFVGAIRDTVAVEAGTTVSASYAFENTGSLRVLVTPWADVYVDGQHVGQTPMDEFQVTVGRHTVLLRHPTMGDKQELVDIRADESFVLEVAMP